ncbi:hypothetical protein, partial [Pantoea septica]|uniref:hypothetical protein n=1 Tax=Pantoea septica TaxID=472695 RepID=UPI0028AFCEF6
MKFLVLLTPAVGRDPAEFKSYAVAEMQAVWHDYKAGALREIYFSPSPVIVSVIYETSARDELETLVAEPKHQRRAYEGLLGAWHRVIDVAIDLPVRPSAATLEALHLSVWGGRR